MSTRWGVMGTGRIAVAMIAAIRAEGGEVAAVSSASPDRARAFAEAHGVPASHAGHHALLTEDLDVVYVATTNDRHHGDALACLRAGVPALVEKPFTLDRRQAQEVVDTAAAAGTFLMEAMWMRCQPGFVELERRVADGQVGAVALVQADFTVPISDPTGRLGSPGLGGGALLDVGVYPLVLALSLLGEPDEVEAVASLTEEGVDRQVAVAMRHPTGTSSFTAGFTAAGSGAAVVAGTAGRIHVDAPFHEMVRLRLVRDGHDDEVIDVPDADLGYRHEVREVHACLADGRTESPRVPWSATLTTMTWLDAIRARIGVEYRDG